MSFAFLFSPLFDLGRDQGLEYGAGGGRPAGRDAYQDRGDYGREDPYGAPRDRGYGAREPPAREPPVREPAREQRG